MIHYKAYRRNFADIQADVGCYMPDFVRDELDKHISNEINEIILEYPYVDKDFRDTYYNDFSKRFEKISRDSVRLHLFYDKDNSSQNNYAGFLTLRDTKVYTIGRSYLCPKALKDFSGGYYCLAEYSVLFKGNELTVWAFPWMQQDGNVSICAHIAAWSVVRYFSQKYPFYPEKTLHEITVHDSPTRRIPSRGATIEQIAQILQKNRFDPEVYVREISSEDAIYKPEEFNRLIYTFIESGIPYIAGLREKKHAVAIVGHGELSDIDSVFSEGQGVVDSCDLVESVILSDDNHLPYRKAYNYENDGYIKLEDIDVLVVPFYQKMYLDVDFLYDRLLPSLEKNLLNLEEGKTLVRRVFITSSRSFKKSVNVYSKDDIYREIHTHLQMPKFIWVAEYSTIDEYKKCLVSNRIIFDATMLKHYEGNFISLKSGSEVSVNPHGDGITGPAIKLKEQVEPMYKNNLRRLQ
ncbi:hypothetical protein [Geopsychrobacter electrodiphilus]|uniref:hypothetical protein n=1 Tax=Geopsychrobacter electrodiphilus TaxID=225196 RepID=UPI00036C5D09|nr:hypothetical protein [Geopsychrobacter electrodiphilus]